MARLHGAIERDPAQHERLIARVKEILARVARSEVQEGRNGVKREYGSARGLHHPLCPTASTCDRPLGPGDAPPHPPRKKLHLGVSRPPSNEISTASL